MRGNASQSQTGIAVVQTSKIKLGGHCKCDYGHVPILLKTSHNLQFSMKLIAKREADLLNLLPFIFLHSIGTAE